MLVNFAFQNFRSFRDQVALRMEATRVKELSKSIIPTEFDNLLPVSSIFGANSSGKSNLLKALKLMRDLVINSSKLNPTDKLEMDPFCLDLESQNGVTSFEIQFILEDSKFRYGFDYNEEGIFAEWLFERRPRQREYMLFIRNKYEYEISKTRFKEGIGKGTLTPANRLFLSLVAQLNGQLSQSILDWFYNIEYVSGNEYLSRCERTLEMIYNNEDGAEEVQRLWSKLDLGFDSIEVHKCDVTGKFYVNTIHTIKDKEGYPVERKSFPLEKMESEGVEKIIRLAGPIIKSLQSGKILIIDDLDTKLHPFITIKIVRLFMDKKVNTKGAQLIFSTHDTNLLNLRFLRRDQVWFTQKDKSDSSELYSLVEYKFPSRKKSNLANDFKEEYMNGRFGAVPCFKG